MRIRDSRDLAWQDWLGTAGFDRDEDFWPRRWAEAYVDFAAGEKRSWLYQQGLKIFPVVGWAERGGYLATGHGNTVPRFHVTWGTGPGVLAPFLRRVRAAEQRGLVSFRFRHRVTSLTRTARRGRRRAGRRARIRQCGTRAGELAAPRRIVRAARAGDHRHVGRHRRQSRAGAAPLAEAPGRAAAAHDLGRAGSRRRPDARRRQGGRRQHHQLRPHVALPGRHPELRADLEPARHPHPERALAALARRDAAGACRRRCFPASIRSARSRTSRARGTITPGSCSTSASSDASSRSRGRSRIRI